MHVNEVDEAKLGQAVRARRQERGLTLKALGGKFGLSGSTVGWVEKGFARKLRLETLLPILTYLDLTLAMFKAGVPEAPRRVEEAPAPPAAVEERPA